MKTFTVKVSMKVSDNWIDDGFDLTTPEWKQEIVEAFKAFLPDAYEHEVEVEILEVKASEPMCQSCGNPERDHFDEIGVYSPCIEQIFENIAARAVLGIDEYPGIDPVGPEPFDD